LIEIIFVVLMIFLLIAGPWPGSPIAGYPWAGHLIYFLLFVCLGLTVYAGFSGGAVHRGL
jgi:hypothetical protein